MSLKDHSDTLDNATALFTVQMHTYKVQEGVTARVGSVPSQGTAADKACSTREPQQADCQEGALLRGRTSYSGESSSGKESAGRRQALDASIGCP
jgi:hypothetical protein